MFLQTLPKLLLQLHVVRQTKVQQLVRRQQDHCCCWCCFKAIAAPGVRTSWSSHLYFCNPHTSSLSQVVSYCSADVAASAIGCTTGTPPLSS